jgi:GTPase SAR1 family protein
MPVSASSRHWNRERKIREDANRLREVARHFGLKEIVKQLDDRDRDARRLMILVVGEGNFGKSSLINALAGRAVAPVALHPNTFKVDIYMQAAGNGEHARLLTAGAIQESRMSVAEARRRCDEEEQRDDRRLKPSILEATWCLDGLAFGPEIGLVDTPGLAQMLQEGQVYSVSLVKGLCATYSVEEVWADWYHRADVVLWCFQANKIESAQTMRAFTTLVKKYRKTIVPVANKADLITIDRWDEIRKRFRDKYRRLLGGGEEVPLFLTVCSEKLERFGHGVKELRDYLLRLAPETPEWKRQASEQHLLDCAREVEGVLRKSADQAVKNLRTIATTFDEIALDGMPRFRKALDGVKDRGASFCVEKGAGLRSELPRIAGDLTTHWRQMRGYLQFRRPNAEQRSELGRLALERLEHYLDLASLTRELNGILDAAGWSIREMAGKIAAVKSLETIRIDQSGNAWKKSIRMSLSLEKSRLRPDIALPTLVLQLPGVAELLWMSIRELFHRPAASRTTLTPAEEEFRTRVMALIAQKVHEFHGEARTQFVESVAKPLAAAADKALLDASGTTMTELSATLKQLDEDMRWMRLILEGPAARATTFELWARYWTSVSREASMVRGLAVELLVPRLSQIRERAASFQPLPPERLEPQGLAEYLKGQAWEVRPVDRAEDAPAPADGWRSAPAFRMGFLDARLVCGFHPAPMVKVLRAPAGVDREYATLPDSLLTEFEHWMATEAGLSRLDKELAEHFPDVRLIGLEAILNGIFARTYAMAMKDAPARIYGPTEMDVPVLALGPVYVSPSLPPGVAVYSSLATAVASLGTLGWYGSLVGLGVGLAVAGWSRKAARLPLRSRIADEIRKAGYALGVAAAQQVSAQITTQTIEQAVEELTIHLTPRPLQRALNGLLE